MKDSVWYQASTDSLLTFEVSGFIIQVNISFGADIDATEFMESYAHFNYLEQNGWVYTGEL